MEKRDIKQELAKVICFISREEIQACTCIACIKRRNTKPKKMAG